MNRPAPHQAIDQFTRGLYAICPECGSRPCVAGCPGPGDQADEPEILSISKPKGGKAVPFIVWDEVIDSFALSITESGVLLYLCRKTFGHGLYQGNYISNGQIAATLRLGPTTVRRTLIALETRGLIVRKRQMIGKTRQFGETFIGVILPGYWPVQA